MYTAVEISLEITQEVEKFGQNHCIYTNWPANATFRHHLSSITKWKEQDSGVGKFLDAAYEFLRTTFTYCFSPI